MPQWLKIKNTVESEFVLLGLERDTEGRPYAHVARERADGLEYAGMAFMTFGERLYTELSQRCEGLATTYRRSVGFVARHGSSQNSECA